MVFKLQYYIEKLSLELELGPGLSSRSPKSNIIETDYLR